MNDKTEVTIIPAEQRRDVTPFVLGKHPDFPEYVVYRDGAVISLAHHRPHRLIPIRTGKYWGFSLRDRDGVIRRVYHHRLVGEIFHGPCPPGEETRHRDGLTDHNWADNLHWGTRSQNMRDKDGHGTSTKGERHPMAKLSECDVLEIRRLRKNGARLEDLMVQFGVSRMTVWRAASGRQWSHIYEG